MRVNIRQKNIEVTPALREYIEEKIIRGVEKFLQDKAQSDLPLLDILVERTSAHHRKGAVYRVEAKFSTGNRVFYAEARGAEVRSVCDQLEEELRHEMYAHKSRMRSLLKRGARVFKKTMRFDPAARFFRKGRMWDEGD